MSDVSNGSFDSLNTIIAMSFPMCLFLSSCKFTNRNLEKRGVEGKGKGEEGKRGRGRGRRREREKKEKGREGRERRKVRREWLGKKGKGKGREERRTNGRD